MGEQEDRSSWSAHSDDLSPGWYFDHASDNDRLALAAHLRVFHSDPFAFDQITATTLVIAGEDDTLSPEPELLANAIPNGQSVTVPGEHSGTRTTAAFINEVTAFLNQ